MASHNPTFDAAAQALAAQPFSRLLGTALIAFEPGEAVLKIPISADVLQQRGFVHGGVLGYAADNALTFAGASVLGPDVLTSEFKINYLKPAIGTRLAAHAFVVSSGRRQAVCRCDITAIAENGQTRCCAAAQGTIVTIVPGPATE